jgi:Fur family transcriptional regulator, iron response regulator
MTDRLLAARSHPSRKPCLTAVLRMAGLRPTRQRVALAELLFGGPHRHVSAEQLHGEASSANVNVSLATIYNTLHQFHEAGLLREVAVDASRSYFDTDTSDHHHFYVEDEQRMIDIPAESVAFASLPQAPKGMQVSHVDVVIRVRRTPAVLELSDLPDPRDLDAQPLD